MEQPQSSDYYSQPFSRYINAPKGHSIYTYDYWALSDEHQLDAAFHGSRVTVLAAHGESSCILYDTQDYQIRVGWVRSAYLSTCYPGLANTLLAGNCLMQALASEKTAIRKRETERR